MTIRVDIATLAKTQNTQRRSPRGGRARAHNRTRTARNHGPDSTFSYSFANKLTNITAGSATANHRYAYDSAGNLTNLLSSTATNRFFYNAQNKLVRIEGRGFTNEFTYDSQNRRIGVKLSATWRYDAHDGNLCIGSVVNGVLDRFFVRGAGIAEGTGDIIAEIPDPRNPSPHPYYYINNHRGDTLAVLDYVYNTAARYEYDAFGNVIEKTGSYTPTYTFSSKEYLPAAGLYLYQYRAYDPIAGRWTQRDPIDYQDSINLYQFCGNNAVNMWDSDGRSATVSGAIGGFAVGFVVGLFTSSSSDSLSTVMGKALSSGLKGAAAGAIAGLIIDTCGAGLGVAVVAGAVANGAVETTSQALEGTLGADNGKLGMSIAFGAAGGSLGSAISDSAASIAIATSEVIVDAAIDAAKSADNLATSVNNASEEIRKAANER